MKVGIVGGGAIGSYYAGLLSRAGTPVTLVTRGDHLVAIKKNGLEIRTPAERFTVTLDATDDGSRVSDCDFVILAVKGYSLPDVAPALADAAECGASIAPLLNGIDVAERLQSLGVRRESIIGGLAAVSVFRTSPGVIERRSPFDRLVFGELDRTPRDRTKHLVETLKAAGPDVSMSDNMPLDLWRKFAFIVPMTIACGLSRGPVGPMLARERGRALVSAALDELIAVGRATGVHISHDLADQLRKDLLALPPATRPSFLADLERGGPTELDLLAGAVSRLGHECGVPTPIHDVAVAAFEAATDA